MNTEATAATLPEEKIETEAAPEPKVERMLSKLPAQRKKLAEQARASYRCNFVNGTTKEDLERPEFWIHHYRDLGEGTLIDGKTDDNKTYFRMIVLAVGHQEAYVKVLEEADLQIDYDVSEVSSEFYAKYAGQQERWQVLRTTDNAIMRTGLHSQEAAETWIRGRRKPIRK